MQLFSKRQTKNSSRENHSVKGTNNYASFYRFDNDASIRIALRLRANGGTIITCYHFSIG